MTWTFLNFAPGVDKDNSPLEAGKKGWWIDADKIRFVAGLPETIYGWERATTTLLTGICRGALTWQDNSRLPMAAFGTHLRLYQMDLDGAVTDITPVTSYARTSVTLTTALNSTTVTVTNWTHGLSVDQKFTFSDPSASSVAGVTIAGTFTVATIEASTSITYTATSSATASTSTTVTLDTLVYLAPGRLDGLTGFGFGVGGFGSGGFGGSSTGYDLFPRTWSLAQWGQSLLASPRGGGIYQWAPNVTNSELVANGTFDSSASWPNASSGWSVNNGVSSASAGAAADFTQAIVTSTAAWHLLQFDIATRSGGTLLPKLGSSSIGSALSSTGRYFLPFFGAGGSQNLTFSKDSSFAGTIDNVSVKVLVTGRLVPGAPTQVGSMFVTAERIVVACGSNLSGSFDPLQLDWSDAEDNQDWTPTSSNLAGGYTLASGGRIVRGLPGTRENVVWTNESLWTMRYNGNPNSVYDVDEVGRGCGLIGPNAAALVGGVWYWMTPAGALYGYDGSAPFIIPHGLARDIFDNLADAQQDKVYASPIVGKNYAEVWFALPDKRDGTECSRYLILDTINKTVTPGTFNRTAWVDRTVFPYPMAVDTSGQVWFHEKGFTEDGGSRSWSLSGSYASKPGSQIVINGVKPDHDDLQGGYAITFNGRTRNARGINSRTYSALNITGATGVASCRVKNDEVAFTISGTAAPAFWRLGAMEIDVSLSSAKK